MPEKSEKIRYMSRYGGGEVSPSQYLAELICENIASKNKTDLEYKFWNNEIWKKTFVSQVIAANSLLKLYQPQIIVSVIIKAIKKRKNVYSLRAKWLHDELKKESLLQQRTAPTTTVIVKKTTEIEKPRENFIENKTTRAKLRDLDE